MKKEALYKTLAKYYDLIYTWKDYEKEAEEIKKLINKYKLSSGNQLLDIACGTGSHIKYFVDDFDCWGVDLNLEMLELAKEKAPKAKFIEADMINLKLEQEFDVIVCLFSSIGYVKTEENLRKTISGFTRHLKKGGVVIIEPWLTKEIYRTGSPHMNTYDGENTKIARVNVSELKDDFISYFEMHYLVAETNKPIMHFVDKHELAMFPIDLQQEIMKENGLQVNYLKKGLFDSRGLLIGQKPM
ncbi:MAG: class I SAM-dependent methyltransferase [Candidatus Heimdallarchaeota archaeon]|nr:MAG: class I SAM-dependent methyltransferase [Candidatus Heimdallarchaeota archaeon]